MLRIMDAYELSAYVIYAHVILECIMPKSDFLLNTLRQNIRDICKGLVLILNDKH